MWREFLARLLLQRRKEAASAAHRGDACSNGRDAEEMQGQGNQGGRTQLLIIVGSRFIFYTSQSPLV